VNAFGVPCPGENCWFNTPYMAISRVWRALREQQAVATVLVPVCESSTWWHLVVLDGRHLYEFVVDCMWLPRGDPNLFIGGTAPDRSVLPPKSPLLAIRVDFSQGEGHSRQVLSTRDRRLHGGCDARRSNSWHRQEQSHLVGLSVFGR
jgi:hypothetical protein